MANPPIQAHDGNDPAKVAQLSEKDVPRPPGSRDVYIKFHGKLHHFRFNVRKLDAFVVLILVALVILASLLAIVAQRRAKDALAAKKRLEREMLERERAEEEIRALNADLERRRGEQRFRALLEAAPDAMVIADTEGGIVFVNSQAEKLFGYSRDELLGRSIEILLPERLRKHYSKNGRNYLTHGQLASKNTKLDLFGLRHDGQEFPVEISLAPIQSEGSMLISTSIRDTTERKRFEEALQEKNIELEKAGQFKDQFLASMSHELRTPLNAILGFTGTLLMRLPGPLTADQEKHLRTVQSSGKHLLSLINDLLDMAKIEAGKVQLTFEPVSCHEVVDEVIKSLYTLAEGKGIALRADLPSQPIQIQTDRRALRQILLNLTNNAIKFTDIGSVRLHITEGFKANDPAVQFEIIDTGTGIPAEHQDKLFQAFSQLNGFNNRRQEGTGLGLYLSQKLAELLSGRITFESAPGQGSTFRLVLPAAMASQKNSDEMLESSRCA